MNINDENYHKINTSEIKTFNTYIPIIRESLKTIKTNFIGKKKTYVYVKNMRCIDSISVIFKNNNLMHLYGVKYKDGSKQFVYDIKHKKLNFHYLRVKDDGSTFQKLQVINQIDILNTLNTRISIGNNIANIHYDSLLRSREDILGIAIKNDENGNPYPLSLLNLSNDITKTLTSFKVLAIIEEDVNTHICSCLQRKDNCPQKVNQWIEEFIRSSTR